MDTPSIRIERTRNRTSRAMLDGDTIVIRLAGRMSLAQEQKHIESLLKRMAKLKARVAAQNTIDPFRSALSTEGDFILALADGTQRTFHIQGSAKTRATRNGQNWNIQKSQDMNDRTFNRFLWRLLSISEKDLITTLVQQINAQTLNVKISSVSLRVGTSRWGSCSRSGRIMLNTALLFVPSPLLTYVIIHELAHVIHPDHSTAFWNTVCAAMPDFESHRSALKAYHLPKL
jgi:predicted metal-dependent hydrolase